MTTQPNSASPQVPEWCVKAAQEISRPKPLCRDCADGNGTCPSTGLPCDVVELRALIITRHAPQPAKAGETPRTDATMKWSAGHLVAVDFARQLERELNEQVISHAQTVSVISAALRERDAAQAKVGEK